jgi:peptide/nickel transport system substrate-binding protein
MHFAYRGTIMSSKAGAALDDPTEYGRKAFAGSGPYKIVAFDRNTGVSFARSETFKKNPYEKAAIKNIEAVFITDLQTQIAHMLTGNIDLMFNVAPDNAAELRANPNIEITTVNSLTSLYMIVDAIGRSERKELMDPRVRKAMFMAIDREALMKAVVPDGEVATRMNAMCFDAVAACAYSTKPVGYDPDGAKKLLAEAGYPNGFDFVLDTQVRARNIAEAIAGMLYKVGIRTSITTVNTLVMFKRWGEGTMQGLINNAPLGAFPDASYAIGVNFGAKERDTVRSETLDKAIGDGIATHDLDKRKAAYRVAFDYMNANFTHYPISSMPVVWAHSKSVRMNTNPLGETRSLVSDIEWK